MGKMFLDRWRGCAIVLKGHVSAHDRLRIKIVPQKICYPVMVVDWAVGFDPQDEAVFCQLFQAGLRGTTQVSLGLIKKPSPCSAWDLEDRLALEGVDPWFNVGHLGLKNGSVGEVIPGAVVAAQQDIDQSFSIRWEQISNNLLDVTVGCERGDVNCNGISRDHFAL